MKARWWLVLGLSLAAGPPGLTTPRDARASVSVEMSFDALLRGSSAAVLATCAEQRVVWEGSRIYTYSRLHVDAPIAGELHEGDDAWVRTMGGVVGKVGQIVDGEPSLTVGLPSLVFLHRSSVSGYAVTGRAQGQYGLYTDEKSEVRLHKAAAGGLVPAKGGAPSEVLAADVIHGRAVGDASSLIASAWGRTHAR